MALQLSQTPQGSTVGPPVPSGPMQFSARAMSLDEVKASRDAFIAAAVRAEMTRLQQSFPDGIEHRIAYDPTLFVRASIGNVIQTLGEALALVVLVVLLFLQSWRAALIPIAAVPVSLIGTLAVMHAAGFTLNTLSLFGLVLSIGIVVDDAIVVVENVERHLARGLSPRQATLAAMREVTGPILAITAVLVAVFVPTAFMGGLSGQFYRQFALTIAISTVISAIRDVPRRRTAVSIRSLTSETLMPRRAIARRSISIDRYCWPLTRSIRRSCCTTSRSSVRTPSPWVFWCA